jgi:hypothetical protein
VNTNGVLYTAQAAGRQMVRFGLPGSIILVASMSGSITNKACSRSIDRIVGAERLTGSRMGSVQHEQVCGAADGAQHGM